MRLFTAISFDEDTRRALVQACDCARMAGISGRFVRCENLHLTLCFLGEVPASRLEDVERAVVQSSQGIAPFSLSFSGPGVFRRRKGDILWLGISISDPLAELHSRQSAELIKSGFLLEQRSFTPHITLARDALIPPDKSLSDIPLPAIAPMTVRNVTVFESSYIGGRLTYIPRKVVALQC